MAPRPPGPDEGFTELRTERLVLRRFDDGDLDALVAYRSDPRVARYQSWAAPWPRAAGERLLRDLRGAHPDTPGVWFQFAVAPLDGGPLLGDCALFVQAEEPRQAEIGFSFAPAHQGRGYAAEAVRRLLGYCFEARGKHRVSARCDARNGRSAALLRRVGMRLEGTFVDAVRDKGEWTTELHFARLRREWPAAEATGRPV